LPPTHKTRPGRKPTIAIVGAGSLASFLAVALKRAGYTITEIVVRDSQPSRRRALTLAAKVGAKVVTAQSAVLEATWLWFCVPDREIRIAASAIADRLSAVISAAKKTTRHQGQKRGVRFALHSSGALLSRELDSLRQAGVAVASAHPLMTFVPGTHPSLLGVPFALEGDTAATQAAKKMIRDLGVESFSLSAKRKAAYHAWATMASPLLLAFMVTLEEAARTAGLAPADARRKSLPIIHQTLANYAKRGPAHSFSGPLIRGDVETIAKHLSELKRNPEVREVYLALARIALRKLPVKNKKELKQLLGTAVSLQLVLPLAAQ